VRLGQCNAMTWKITHVGTITAASFLALHNKNILVTNQQATKRQYTTSMNKAWHRTHTHSTHTRWTTARDSSSRINLSLSVGLQASTGVSTLNTSQRTEPWSYHWPVWQCSHRTQLITWRLLSTQVVMHAQSCLPSDRSCSHKHGQLADTLNHCC
jgi:hypothetical protein